MKKEIHNYYKVGEEDITLTYEFVDTGYAGVARMLSQLRMLKPAPEKIVEENRKQVVLVM